MINSQIPSIKTAKQNVFESQSKKSLELKLKVEKQARLKKSGQQEQEKRIGPDQFVAHQLLGTGSFGEVFLVERKSDKKLLAMKVLSKKKIRE